VDCIPALTNGAPDKIPIFSELTNFSGEWHRFPLCRLLNREVDYKESQLLLELVVTLAL
jgi:hypothetical protein